MLVVPLAGHPVPLCADLRPAAPHFAEMVQHTVRIAGLLPDLGYRGISRAGEEGVFWNYGGGKGSFFLVVMDDGAREGLD